MNGNKALQKKLVYSLGTLVILFVIVNVLIAIGVDFNFFSKVSRNPPYPYFLDTYTSMGPNSKYEIHYFQPFVNHFTYNDEKNWLVLNVSFRDSKNKVRSANVFIEGKINQDKVTSVFLQDTASTPENIIKGERLRSIIAEGQQIQIAYLTVISLGAGGDEEICQTIFEYCELGSLAMEERVALDNLAFENTFEDEAVIIPAFYVTTELVTHE